MIDAGGVLERIEGRQLVAMKTGSRGLTPTDAAALIADASALATLPPPSAPYEGDLYTIVDANRRTITTPESIAPAELKAFVQKILSEGESVTLQDNTEYYVSAEPVQEDRLQRLQSRGRTAADPATLDATSNMIVWNALQSPYRMYRVDEAQFRALESALAGRESFVAQTPTAWHQLNLWSPPL
jgi:hypothetical protein